MLSPSAPLSRYKTLESLFTTNLARRMEFGNFVFFEIWTTCVCVCGRFHCERLIIWLLWRNDRAAQFTLEHFVWNYKTSHIIWFSVYSVFDFQCVKWLSIGSIPFVWLDRHSQKLCVVFLREKFCILIFRVQSNLKDLLNLSEFPLPLTWKRINRIFQ